MKSEQLSSTGPNRRKTLAIKVQRSSAFIRPLTRSRDYTAFTNSAHSTTEATFLAAQQGYS